MFNHAVFPNIWLHSNEELAQTLGLTIVERQTIHEWPLSCVQRLKLADGTKLIYKSQLPPTVESQFYEQATSPLLPRHWRLGKLGECETMTLEWIEAPLLSEIALDETALVAHGKRVLEQLAQIKGELPVHLDIGSAARWLGVAAVMCEKLKKLVREGQFKLVELSEVDRVHSWASSSDILTTVTSHPRLVHGDLKTDQIFLTKEGYRVIDWQRPLIGPPEVDLVGLLVGQGIVPSRYVEARVVAIYWFLYLHWAVEAQFDLFPGFKGQLFDNWAKQSITHILSDPSSC